MWWVVIAGPMDAVPGERIGVAVRNGSSEECGGLAAVRDGVELQREEAA
ncbi:MAG: hypothetical protein QF515_17955 [Pseudomonadales bacterium]|nr:hypothetical protein [Pseudomonadales bacterium]MDP6828979.1 hypothetical protein [Pseudomonadales bacterium]